MSNLRLTMWCVLLFGISFVVTMLYLQLRPGGSVWPF